MLKLFICLWCIFGIKYLFHANNHKTEVNRKNAFKCIVKLAAYGPVSWAFLLLEWKKGSYKGKVV